MQKQHPPAAAIALRHLGLLSPIQARQAPSAWLHPQATACMLPLPRAPLIPPSCSAGGPAQRPRRASVASRLAHLLAALALLPTHPTPPSASPTPSLLASGLSCFCGLPFLFPFLSPCACFRLSVRVRLPLTAPPLLFDDPLYFSTSRHIAVHLLLRAHISVHRFLSRRLFLESGSPKKTACASISYRTAACSAPRRSNLVHGSSTTT